MSRLVLALVLLLPAWAADLSGRWSGTFRSEKRTVSLHFEFHQSPAGIVGSFGTRPDFLAPLRNIRLAGNTLTFELKMGLDAKFDGSIESGYLSGDLTSSAPGLCGKLEMKPAGPAWHLPASFQPEDGNVTSLGDEFDNPANLKRWKNLSEAEGWPDRIETIAVNQDGAGHLRLAPASGAWWGGYHGVFLYKEVKGDFVLTTRLKVTGRTGGEPANIWTLSGLLLRCPADLRLPREQRKENWIYVMTGRGPAQARVVDAKSTVDGANAWDITPAQPGWHELRFVRLGSLFVGMCRPDGGDWIVRKRIVREDLPETIQAGINATSDFDLSASMPAPKYNAELFPGRSKADSITLYDYVRFSRIPRALRAKLAGQTLLAIADSDLLALVE
jgi:hypothetical protein